MLFQLLLVTMGQLQRASSEVAGAELEIPAEGLERQAMEQRKQNTTLVVKADLDGDKRRIPFDSRSFVILLRKLGVTFQVPADLIMVRYLDEDSEMITIASDTDLAMAWEATGGKSWPRLALSLRDCPLAPMGDAVGEPEAMDVLQHDGLAATSSSEEVSSRIEGLLAASPTAATRSAAMVRETQDERNGAGNLSHDESTTDESMERLMRLFLKHEITVGQPKPEEWATDHAIGDGELDSSGSIEIVSTVKVSHEVPRIQPSKIYYAVGVISGRQEWVIDVHKSACVVLTFYRIHKLLVDHSVL